MIRKQKLFSRPKEPFNTERIKSENEVVRKYGLKNKREVWRAQAKLDKIRGRAKKLVNAPLEEQEKFLKKLTEEGFSVTNTPEVLALTPENILDRRLQTVVFKLGLANTPKESRQLITHKKIKVNGNVVNKPSFEVSVENEKNIEIVKKERKEVKKEIVENEKEKDVKDEIGNEEVKE